MNLIKSKKRVADHGEVFTPPWMVEAMLNLVKDETERIDSRFLEPACGSGNFLVRVLQRKLGAVEFKFGKSDFEKRQYALLALMCIYGIELLEDNIAECRANMLEILTEYLNVDHSDDLYRAACYVLSQNLVHGNALRDPVERSTLPLGSSSVRFPTVLKPHLGASNLPSGAQQRIAVVVVMYHWLTQRALDETCHPLQLSLRFQALRFRSTPNSMKRWLPGQDSNLQHFG